MRMVALAPATAIALALYIAAPAAASDATDVMATVREYLGDFNKGDADQAAGLCAPQAIIIDDFPPHTWQGPTACLDWWNALVAFDKSKGITDEDVTIGKPRRVVVTGDRAYVVVPATYKYKENGKPVTEFWCGLDIGSAKACWWLARRGMGLGTVMWMEFPHGVLDFRCNPLPCPGSARHSWENLLSRVSHRWPICHGDARFPASAGRMV